MRNHKRFGIFAAVLTTACVLGVTAYGFGNTEKEERDPERITLDSAINLNGDAMLDETSLLETETTDVQETAVQGLPNVQKVAKDVMPAIVAITQVGTKDMNYFGRVYEVETEGSGSGIIVAKSDDELLIATNNHVVADSKELTVCFSVDVDEEDEDKLLAPALIKGTDSSMDLAVVAVKLEDIDKEILDKIAIVQLGDSDSMQVGEWVVAIGNAMGYGQSVTAGVVSALNREVTVDTGSGIVTNNMIQTDAAINFGNSGGALLDMNGRLVGINSVKATVSYVEGMGYAIPINTAKPIIEDLMNETTRSKVDEDKAGALGIQVRDVSAEAQQLYNVPSGALVYGLTRDSAAEKAGVCEGDIITKLDKTNISTRKELIDRLQYYEAGETVLVTLLRFEEGGGYVEKQIEVTLGKKSDLLEQDQDDEDVPADDDYYDDDSRGYGLEDFFEGFGF